MTNKEFYFIGAGGNCKVLIDLALDCNYVCCGIFDDSEDKKNFIYRNVSVLGKIDDINNYQNLNLIITIGNINFRKKFIEKYNKIFNFPNLIHPNVYLSPTVIIGKGNYLYNQVIINSDVKIGDFNIINTRSLIEHDCQIGQNNLICPNVVICGTVIIGNNNFIGANSTFRNAIQLGSNNLIGCGTNIIKSFGNDLKIIGNPASIKL